MAGRPLVERVAPVAARLDKLGEAGAVGAQQLQGGALGGCDLAGQAHRTDRRAPGRVGVESHRLRTPVQRAQQLHAMHDTANDRDVAVQLPR